MSTDDTNAARRGSESNDLLGLLRQALTALENFDRFRRMMEDGPDASDKLLAEDYAEMAFVQGAQLIPLLRSALKA
jgi:hypothetical protein